MALATVLVAALTSCSAPTTPVELPRKNIAEWVMPLDSYIDTARFEPYAQNLLAQPCMERAGFEWDVPYRDVTSTNGPSWNAIDRKLFNVDLATRFGYHVAADDDSTAEAWSAFATDVSPEADAAFSTCLKSANRELKAPDDVEQLAGQLEGSAYDAALESDPVRNRARAWRKCMVPLGLSDLPRSPHLMPSSSQQRAFALDTTPTATSEEIRQAAFDARCQDSTGYLHELYEQEWTRQIPLLQENEDRVSRVRAESEAYEKRISRAISEHAPSH